MSKKSPVLKDKKVAQSNYYREKLAEYIRTNPEAIFADDNRAEAWSDYVLFSEKVDRYHLCLPTEPFLVDRRYKNEHWYCICTISENRKVTSELPVIAVSEIPRGIWKNGYFLLPNLVTNLTN